MEEVNPPKSEEVIDEGVLRDSTNTVSSIKPYLEKVWSPEYAFELYTVELNKLALAHSLSSDQILSIAYS